MMKEDLKKTIKDFSVKSEYIIYMMQWLACGICFIVHLSLLLLFYIYDVKPLMYYNIFSVTLYVLLFFYLGECPRDKREYATQIAAIEIIIHHVLSIHFVGTGIGFQHFLLPTATYMLLYSASSKRIYRVNSVLASFCMLIYGLYGYGLAGYVSVYELPTNVTKILYNISSVVSMIFLITVVWVLSYLRNRSYDTIREKNMELQRLVKNRTDILDSMNHGIRTPLNVVVGMTEMTLHEEISPQARENLEYIQSSGKRLMSVVNDILDISKIDAGKLKIGEKEYSPLHMLQDVISISEVKAKEKQLRMQLNIRKELPEALLGDEARIRQVLINLSRNAIESTLRGKIILDVSCVVENEYCSITFSINDNGTDVKPESLDHDFQEFERADAIKHYSSQGSGLSLPISNKLVSLMGGKLWVDTAYEVGSNFYFTIKQKIKSRTPAKLERKKTVPFTTKDTKVLVVDDSILNLKVSNGYMSKFGMVVDQAEDGYKALEKVKNNIYDLIFMDYMMPEKDGVETMQDIRGLDGEYYQSVPIIALTANVAEENQLMLLEKGFQDIIPKPIDMNVLARVMKKWLDEEKNMKESQVPEK